MLIARRFLATLMGPATIENTKLSIDVSGEPFTASGDVLVDAGFREAYPYGLKRDEQLPPLAEGDAIDVSDIKLEAKQTEPPARYSQGRLVQEMEKRGLGTKSTRASIIERLYQVRYLKNDPIEPSQLGMAIVDALHEFAPRITTPEMTSELEDDMTHVAAGADTQEHVVEHSRALLAGMLDTLIAHKDDLGEAIADAVTADAKVARAQVRQGPCDENERQDARELHRVHGLAGVRRDLSGTERCEGLADRRRGGGVSRVRCSAHQVPAVQAEGL